ncbi:uracil-DNA glycosylase, partial [Candidatus Curtissbacteria bacterium]|nr:uracil-DNA glycosylase [Candidatus Curtissbacteria bacterium]
MKKDVSLPLREGATQLVFGEGNPDTDLYFLGEAPGYYEDKEGRPFVGLAGKLLDQLIQSIGYARSDVYISNVVRFRPPANRDPLPEEIDAFTPYVNSEIAIIGPKVIVTLGRFSMNKFLPEVRISGVHGKVFNVDFNGKEVTVIPMYHPAAALRSTQIMAAIKEDFQKIKSFLEGKNQMADFFGEETKEEKKEASQLS